QRISVQIKVIYVNIATLSTKLSIANASPLYFSGCLLIFTTETMPKIREMIATTKTRKAVITAPADAVNMKNKLTTDRARAIIELGSQISFFTGVSAFICVVMVSATLSAGTI